MLMYPSPSYDTISKNALDGKDQVPSFFFFLHILTFFCITSIKVKLCLIIPENFVPELKVV